MRFTARNLLKTPLRPTFDFIYVHADRYRHRCSVLGCCNGRKQPVGRAFRWCSNAWHCLRQPLTLHLVALQVGIAASAAVRKAMNAWNTRDDRRCSTLARAIDWPRRELRYIELDVAATTSALSNPWRSWRRIDNRVDWTCARAEDGRPDGNRNDDETSADVVAERER